VNDYTKFGIGAAVVLVVFGVLWKLGHVARLAAYFHETREELRKCTWPTVDELKGSTVVVMITIVGLGIYTMGIDFIIALLVSLLNTINKSA